MVARILIKGVMITVNTPNAISPIESIEAIEVVIESSDIVCFASVIDELDNAMIRPIANRTVDVMAPASTM